MFVEVIVGLRSLRPPRLPAAATCGLRCDSLERVSIGDHRGAGFEPRGMPPPVPRIAADISGRRHSERRNGAAL